MRKRSTSIILPSFGIGVLVLALGAILTGTFVPASKHFTWKGEDLSSTRKNLGKQEGRTMDVLDKDVLVKEIIGLASWYGESQEECVGCRADKITACGERFDEKAFTLAHNELPCNTLVRIYSGENTVIARVTDTGGFGRYKRLADLSKATFAALAPLEEGIINVRIQVLASLQEK